MFDGTIRISNDNPLPRYVQVQRILRELVATGRLKPGDKIPAEINVAEALGVSKMTVNKAVLTLTANGLFVREVGRGTFVTSDALIRLTMPEIPTHLQITLSLANGIKDIMDSAYYGPLYEGIRTILSSEPDMDLVIAPLTAEDYLAEEERTPADGRFLIAPRIVHADSISQLWDQGNPLVVVGASWQGIRVASVDSDNVGGASAAMRHLMGRGHRNILLIYAEIGTANTQDRIMGYRQALADAGIEEMSERIIEAPTFLRLGTEVQQTITRLITAPIPVTAIFAASYYLALEAMNVVRAAGKRVPEDVSVVGYDDPLSAQFAYPPLTTVRQPLRAMGQRAAEILLNLLKREEGTMEPIHELLSAEVVVRGSTAIAPAS